MLDRYTALLSTYSAIVSVTLTRAYTIIYVSNLNDFLNVLEKNAINIQEVTESGSTHHSFGVFTIPVGNTAGQVYIPHNSSESVVKNLLIP